jgi:hypothetical protein
MLIAAEFSNDRSPGSTPGLLSEEERTALYVAEGEDAQSARAIRWSWLPLYRLGEAPSVMEGDPLEPASVVDGEMLVPGEPAGLRPGDCVPPGPHADIAKAAAAVKTSNSFLILGSSRVGNRVVMSFR